MSIRMSNNNSITSRKYSRNILSTSILTSIKTLDNILSQSSCNPCKH